MRIVIENSAAVLVDLQERLFPHIHAHEHLENNIKRLIKGLQILDAPIRVTQQYTKGLGNTIPSVASILQDADRIEKIAFSCCGEPSFMEALNRLQRPSIILFGIEAHVCVMQTALDLVDADYQPVIVEDCIGSRGPNDKSVAVERLRDSGCIITTSESLLFELCKEAGTDRFKQISKLVK